MCSIMQKGPLCPESLSYQNKDGLAWPAWPMTTKYKVLHRFAILHGHTVTLYL